MAGPHGEPPPPHRHEIMAVRSLRVPYYRYELEMIDPEFMRRVVLVAGSIGDYTCYEGIGPAEWVRDYGNKLPFYLAKAWFPALEEARYRE